MTQTEIFNESGCESGSTGTFTFNIYKLYESQCSHKENYVQTSVEIDHSVCKIINILNSIRYNGKVN